MLIKLQDKTVRLINFQPLNAPVGPLYQENKILKVTDFINYKNILRQKFTMKRKLTILQQNVYYVKSNHACKTRAAT